MFKNIVAAVAVLACLASCATAAPPTTAHARAAAEDAAARVRCTPFSELTTGTSTAIGEAVVTARHVVEACSGQIGAAYSSGEYSDFSILTVGDPGICIDATPGEPLIFAGFPATRRIGGDRLDAVNQVLELDTGTTVSRDINVASLGGRPIVLRRIEGLTSAATKYVRGGYSGGPVVSAVDGRVVGITNAAATDGSFAYFTPVTLICDQIRKEQARE
jgi:hypothetical protein